MKNIIESFSDDITDFDGIFNKVMKWGYYLIAPLACFWWFRLGYLPVILNKFFGCADNVQFPNAASDLGFWSVLFYEAFHPPMYMAHYFNSCTFGGKWVYMLTMMPGFVIVFSIIYFLIMAMIYRCIWDKFIGPTVGDYLRPVVNSAFRDIKR